MEPSQVIKLFYLIERMLNYPFISPLNYKINSTWRKKAPTLLIFAVSKATILTMKVVLCTITLLLVCVILLGVRVLFVRGGKFPDSHAHSSEALRKKGIGCMHGQSQSD